MRPAILPLSLFAALVLTAACRRASPEADADLATGLPWLFTNFEADDEDIAPMLRGLETQTYLSLELDGGVVPRSLEPELLTEDNVAEFTRPDRDLTLALPMAVARLSEFSGEDHNGIVMMPDQVPVEPYSPDLYDRSFVEGQDCYLDRSCVAVRTVNDLIKKNALMEVRYTMHKDFRWVDMSDDDTPRWATIARSWVEESATGDSGKATIQQAFTIEYTIPRDGRGFSLSTIETEDPPTHDSDGTGTIRLQALWSETTFEGISIGDTMVKGTIRAGIDKNFEAADDFLAEQDEG
ncbi:MAG: hypothetical protein AB8H79_16690 [Myxococcota bacterium]